MGSYEMNSPKPQPGTNVKQNYTLYGDSEELNRDGNVVDFSEVII